MLPGLTFFLPVLTGSYQHLPFYFTGFYPVSPDLTGYFQVLLGLTGSYWVLTGLTGNYGVSLGLTKSYHVLPGLTWCYRVVPCLTGFNRVLPGSYNVLLGFSCQQCYYPHTLKGLGSPVCKICPHSYCRSTPNQLQLNIFPQV